MAEYLGEFGRGEKRVQLVRLKINTKKVYVAPILRSLSLQQAKVVLNTIKKIFSHTAYSNPKVIAITSKFKKQYRKPDYQKLTPEQIKLLLIGQFNLGDESAGDLLDRFFLTPSIPANAKKQAID
jgi:hypothetical protein